MPKRKEEIVLPIVHRNSDDEAEDIMLPSRKPNPRRSPLHPRKRRATLQPKSLAKNERKSPVLKVTSPVIALPKPRENRLPMPCL